MKKAILFCLFSLFALSVSAQLYLQPKAMRIYRDNDQIVVRDSAGLTPPELYPFTSVSIGPFRSSIRVSIDGAVMYFPFAKVLDRNGVPYSTSSLTAALSAYQATIPNMAALLTGYYLDTPVATKALANAAATGTQRKIITVAVDESDGNRRNVYLYPGDNQPLGYPLF